jgi:integrase
VSWLEIAYSGFSTRSGALDLTIHHKDSSGKWRQKSESTGLKEKGNKRRAETKMKERLDELEAELESVPIQKGLLFLDAMEQWLNDVMSFKVRENTLHQYQHVFDKHIRAFPSFVDTELKQVTPQMLQDYVSLKSKTLAPETVRKHHANLHKFFEHAWRLELIDRNPADRIELPPRNREQRGKVYSETQLNQLLELFKGDVLETLIMITATYGLRRSEICGLKWDAIDFDAGPTGSLTIKHTAIVDCGKVCYSDRTKSRSSRRKLPMTPTIRQQLKIRKVKQAENQLLMGGEYKNLGYICCWPDGSPLLPEYVTKHYKSVIEENGFPFIQLRNLRDSAATLLHKKGYDAKSIQPLLGHADASTTANIYIHSHEDDLLALADTLENSLSRKLNAG